MKRLVCCALAVGALAVGLFGCGGADEADDTAEPDEGEIEPDVGDDETDIGDDETDIGDDETGIDDADADDGGDETDASNPDVDVDADVAPDVCAPDCAAKQCGPDGCGGTCGECVAGSLCAPDGGCYVPGCVARCGDKQCGDNGCAGLCGTCDDPALPVCAGGACAAVCVPDCVGKECGPDGCGATCGSCAGGNDCSSQGRCVPAGWTCEPATYDARDHCDCGCGAPDPDCDIDALALLGCDLFERCVAGVCTPRAPAAWTCTVTSYDDGAFCECGCGAADPDCADPDLPVLGCGAGETCGGAGTCEACVGSCAGRECGDDGCGRSCGGCVADEVTGEVFACVAGACVPGCAPTPVVCLTSECGDDGCGGECGTCGAGEQCVNGQCLVEADMSCSGRCGIQAPGGCGCDDQCGVLDDCCPDYVERCVCVPDCDGKACGDDGCGGACGACDAGLFCGPDGQCSATCTPRCEGRQCGPDGCGGVCGACGDGTCDAAGQCIPGTWLCPDYYYGEGAACDCSCGAADPDCLTIGLTNNCPQGAACGDATGICDVAFCGANDQCHAPAWCVGHFPTGGVARKGVCRPPKPAAAAPGAACTTSNGCATELCAHERCRLHCQVDEDCGAGQTCIGLSLVQPLTGREIGIVSVCDDGADIGEPCTQQADCGGGSSCLALIHPTTFAPMLRCGVPEGGGPEGADCESGATCAIGLVCAGGHCGRACPAGSVDCASGSCVTATLHPGASSSTTDDVQTKACR